MVKKSLSWWQVAIVAAILQAIVGGAIGVWPRSYGRSGPENMRDDLRIYYEYASKAMEGQVPYRDYVVEYPLAAFPFLFLPRLFVRDLPAYWVAIGLEMLLANAVGVLGVAWWVNRYESREALSRRLIWYSVYFLALCPLLLTRFDMIPTVTGFAAACFWYSGRAGAGGFLAGLGALMKIFPGVLAAPGFVWDLAGRGTRPQRGSGPQEGELVVESRSPVELRFRRGWGTFTFVATAAAGALGWVALGGVGVIRSLNYHVERGLEIGSVYSGLLMAISTVRGTPLTTLYTHSSMELIAPGSGSLAGIAFPLQVAALLFVAWRFWRTESREPMRYATAAILAFVVFGKVLSPQYMIWLLPFVAVLGGRVGMLARWAFVGACCATTLIYPWGMHRVLSFHPLAILALNGRNGLLLGMWLLLAAGPGHEAKKGLGAVP